MALPTHLAVRVVVRETASGAEQGFKLFYRLDSGPAPGVDEIQVTANDFKTAFTSALPGVFPSSHTFNRVELVYLSGGTQVDAVSNTAAVAGSVSGDVMPEEVAALIQRRTGKPGRNKRGRVFIPAVPDSFCTGSTLTSGAMTAYQAVAAMILGPVSTNASGNDWIPVTPDYKTNVLEDVVQARAYSEVVSRRDRRFVKRGSVLAA